MARLSTNLLCLLSLLLCFCKAFASDLDSYLDAETLDFAKGYDKRLRYAPETVVVFDQEYIERTGALNLTDLLEHVVGVHVTRKVFGSSSHQFVRGINGQWLLLHNGVQIERILPEMLSIPVTDIERLEVLKGSHFAMYGPSAIVGTVNIITFGPSENLTSVGVRGGQLGTHETFVRKSDSSGVIAYSAYLSHWGTDGSDAIIDRDRQTGLDESLSTSASLAPGQGSFERQSTDARLTLELGENWSLNQYLVDRSAGVGVGLVQALDPSGEENLFRYTADLRYNKPVARGRFEGQFIYNRVEASYDDVFLLPPGTLGGLFPDGVQQSYGQTGTEITANLFYRVSLGNHLVEFGIGAKSGEVNNDYDERNYTVQNNSPIPVPIGDIADTADDAPLFADNYSNTDSYLLLRDRWKVSKNVSLNLGAGIDHSSEYGTVFNPRFSIDWIAGQYTNVHFLYGQSSIIPTVIETTSTGVFSPLGNDQLVPAKIRMAELSIEQEVSENLSLSANAFVYKQIGDIGAVPSDASPNGREFVNLSGEEDGAGIDITASWDISQNTNLRFGAAFETKKTDNPDAEIAPSFLPQIELTHSFNSRWDMMISGFGVFNRERTDDDERAPADDYVIVNASVFNRTMFNNATLSLSVQNVFDADATEDISEEITFDLPILPRRALLGIKFTL